MKKRKADTSQTIKKGKGKWKDSLSESEEASEIKDEELRPCLLSLQNQSGKSGATINCKAGFPL